MAEFGTQGPIWRSKISNFDFDHFFSRIERFWVILSKKKFFEKLVEKWLSLEASKHWKGSDIQKSQKKASDFGFNHLFSRIGPFWVIWSKKEISKISTDYPIWPFLAVMAPRQKLYLLKKFFSGPEIFRECSSQYYLPFLRITERSNVKKLC